MFAVDFTLNFPSHNEIFIEFYMTSPDENGSSIIYQYISPVSCTAEMFPSSLASEVEYFQISTYFICPNLTYVKFINEKYFSSFQYFEVKAVLE